MGTRREFLIGTVIAPLACAANAGKAPVEVLPVPAGGIQPQIALTQSGLHLIYFLGEASHGDVFYVSSPDFGRTFSPPIRVNSQPGSAIAVGSIRGAQISAGKQDRVHVAWNGSGEAQPRGPMNPESRKPSSPMLYARLDGSTFEPQRNLIHETFGLDGGGSVTADRNGNVYVAWHGKVPGAAKGEAGRRVWVARSSNDGDTFSAERAVSPAQTGACGCCALRVFADSRGIVYGLYRSATQNVHRDIYLLRSADQANSFSAALLHPWDLNACPMSSMDLIETGDEVIGAWETQTQIYFAPVSRGLDGAKAKMIAPPGTNPKRKYPAIAQNRRGETLVAWVEGSGWQHGGVFGWQIFDPSGRPGLSCATLVKVPVWSFPAVFARPDETFTILV